MRIFLPIIISLFFLSCSGGNEPAEDIDIEETLEEMTADMLGPVWIKASDGEYFEMEIPSQMEAKENLNQEASLQYRYLSKTDSMVLEHYVIAIVEPFPQGRDLFDSIDVAGYTEAYIDSLMIDRKYEEMNEPAIESINETDATIHELQSTIKTQDGDEVNIFYMLGVYKGHHGIYQVLTWTLMDQKDVFRGDMRHMLYSLKEL